MYIHIMYVYTHVLLLYKFLLRRVATKILRPAKARHKFEGYRSARSIADQYTCLLLIFLCQTVHYELLYVDLHNITRSRKVH